MFTAVLGRDIRTTKADQHSCGHRPEEQPVLTVVSLTIPEGWIAFPYTFYAAVRNILLRICDVGPGNITGLNTTYHIIVYLDTAFHDTVLCELCFCFRQQGH